MKVTEIVVSAGRVVSHPLESYSNLRPQVTLKAQLDEGEDYTTAVKELQARAEGLVEDHKNALVNNIVELDRLQKREREIASLEKSIRRDQATLTELRNGNAALPALTPARAEPYDAYDHEDDREDDRDDSRYT